MKDFFVDEDKEISDNAETQAHFCLPSKWMPLKGRDTALETYKDTIRRIEMNSTYILHEFYIHSYSTFYIHSVHAFYMNSTYILHEFYIHSTILHTFYMNSTYILVVSLNLTLYLPFPA